MEHKIQMVHGSGGVATSELINTIFAKIFANRTLDKMEDSAVVDGAEKIAVTTDSFVVTPISYLGGDIGRLCICGTVNDLLMRGAKPKYITCGFILQEGLEIEKLEEVVRSMAETAKEAGVEIVAGDTKVVNGNGELFINTAGVGFVPKEREVSAERVCEGDVILVSGTLGDHHAAILSSRMGITNQIESDNAPLGEMVEALFEAGIDVHTMRDVTRGGLATILKELANTSHMTMELEESKLPITPQVKDFCGLLGLDPLYMGNEGKLVVLVPKAQAEKAQAVIKNAKYGENAQIIGYVKEQSEGKLLLRTRIGGLRNLEVLQGEGLPRIC
ncbi:MAG: hydrogenase expression/formation protein HypE [Lachnospiraceae bacterium]|nr:hydrogenase expression/formation protein HypE [Lachnospiraceae bacterium]